MVDLSVSRLFLFKCEKKHTDDQTTSSIAHIVRKGV